MSKHKYKSSIIGCFIVLCLAIAAIFFIIERRPDYREFISTDSPEQVENLHARYQTSPELEHDFYYRQGCHNCMKMQSAIVPLLKHDSQQRDHLVVLNDSNHLKHFIQTKEQVEAFPTISIRYHGYLIYQYSGMNKTIFRQLFHNIDPDTGERFKRAVPKQSVVVNQFDGTHSHQPSYKSVSED